MILGDLSLPKFRVLLNTIADRNLKCRCRRQSLVSGPCTTIYCWGSRDFRQRVLPLLGCSFSSEPSTGDNI